MISNRFHKITTNSPNAPVTTSTNIVITDPKIKGVYEKTINELVKAYEKGTDKLNDLANIVEEINKKFPNAKKDHEQLENLLCNLLEDKAPTEVKAQTLSGIHGIPNKSKTDCAFISILQLIIHTPTLRQKVEEHLPEIYAFVLNYEKGIDSTELHKVFNAKFFPKRNLSQEDIAEYLEKLLDSVGFKVDVDKLFAQSSDISIIPLKIANVALSEQLSKLCKKKLVTFESSTQDLYFHLDRTTPVSLGHQDTVICKDEREYIVPFNFDYKGSEYELTFVSVQKGDAKEGHYISYIKKGDDWYKNNDSTVENITDNNEKEMSDDIFKEGCFYHYQKVKKSVLTGETKTLGISTLQLVSAGLCCLSSVAFVALPLLGLF